MKNNYIHNSNKLSEKLKWRYWKFFVLAILGGFFVGLGYIAYFSIMAHGKKYGAGGFAAAAIFPVGLIFCVFFGGSLFTSDSSISLKFLEKKAKLSKLFIIWAVVWAGNLVGSFLCAALSVWANLYGTEEMANILQKTAEAKANISWYSSIGSGIICNVLVSGTIWIVNSLKNETPKLLVIWIIITLFVITGTQHVVANMYVFLTGWIMNVDFSAIGAIFENLLPTTLGNWIAGAIFIPGVAFLLNHWTVKEPFEN